jgi:hypothetical protein
VSWLTNPSPKPSIDDVAPMYDFTPCYHCGKDVEWHPEDKRASDEGSFVAQEDGSFECPSGFLHQG